MSAEHIDGSVLNVTFETFANSRVFQLISSHPYSCNNSLLPFFCGTEVVIRIGSANHTYRLPKALLCSQSSYFAAMFKQAQFKEGAEQSATLEEIDGVVSIRSFEMLLQWVCLGRIVFGDSLSADDAIALSIEFARLADMSNVTGTESLMADHIKSIILSNALLHEVRYGSRDHNANNYFITTQHIESAALLPNGHPVRGVLAMAMVEAFFQFDDHRFQKEIREVPGFAIDILAAVKATSKTITPREYYTEFKEPLSGEVLRLQSQ